MELAQAIFRFFSSLKLAVFVIVGFAVALTAATILESIYDTPTAQYWVYRSFWFFGVLTLLGINIFCVAMSRYPWKKKHTPFLLAHLGILILLAGSWITDRFGLDGSLRVSEGETAAVVEINSPTLVFTEGENVKSMLLEWLPPGVKFKPIEVATHDLRVDQYLSHAEPSVSFASADGDAGQFSFPAVRIRLVGGPMRISQEYWLWGGDPGWNLIQAGPARLAIRSAVSTAEIKPTPGSPLLVFASNAQGDLTYEAFSSEGKKVTGRLARDQAQGKVIHPGWRGDVTVTVLDWFPRSVANTTYKPSKIQYGMNAPPSAIHVVAGTGGPGAEMWLGLGDRAILALRGREIGVGYFPKRVVLPYGIRLEKFSIEHYQGTRDPSEFSSKVSVVEGKQQSEPITISMNEPLTKNKITFYQSSYEPADPRPTVSIFSVNRDPGRWMKYIGSLLIVFGAISLFSVKYQRAKAAKQVPIPSPGGAQASTQSEATV